jgi:hypothetical protein
VSNYKGVNLYGDSAAEEFRKVMNKGATRVVYLTGKHREDMGIVSPLGRCSK